MTRMMSRKFEQWFKYRDESKVNAAALPIRKTRMKWAKIACFLNFEWRRKWFGNRACWRRDNHAAGCARRAFAATHVGARGRSFVRAGSAVGKTRTPTCATRRIDADVSPH
jgi:hypothetical protein